MHAKRFWHSFTTHVGLISSIDQKRKKEGSRAFHNNFPSGSCDESCGLFADEKIMTIGNFPQLEWPKRLTPAPKRLM
jgi:hypothetical protein